MALGPHFFVFFARSCTQSAKLLDTQICPRPSGWLPGLSFIVAWAKRQGGGRHLIAPGTTPRVDYRSLAQMSLCELPNGKFVVLDTVELDDALKADIDMLAWPPPLG